MGQRNNSDKRLYQRLSTKEFKTRQINPTKECNLRDRSYRLMQPVAPLGLPPPPRPQFFWAYTSSSPPSLTRPLSVRSFLPSLILLPSASTPPATPPPILHLSLTLPCASTYSHAPAPPPFSTLSLQATPSPVA